MTIRERQVASFRDPSGFLFSRQGVLYRQVNRSYQEHYDRLMDSGLYHELVGAGLLIAHKESRVEPTEPALAYKVLEPERVGFISYPYEWSFSQLKDAALATLSIQKRALARGMSLKDSSAYNTQFHRGRPLLVDTLSFEIYREGEPWDAYRQFCQHFLGPLALMAHTDIRLSQLLRVYIDGLPLDLVTALLPGRTRWNLSLLTHLHVHAGAQRRYAEKTVERSGQKRRMSRIAFLGLVDSLEGAVRGLSWKPAGTEWAEYYTDTNYTEEALHHKRQIVEGFLDRIHPATVWDLGANTGLFSRLASARGVPTVAFDVDPGAVEQNYLQCVEEKEVNLLPLIMDLTNPSPGIGWQNRERMSLLDRGPADAALALALIHHLAVANNVPLAGLADFFQQVARWLVIEFVPKTDSQVQRLLATRQDIFPDYTQEGFERAFARSFTVHESIDLRGSLRRLYLMERR
jgi:ribosomal protein L11 methylase PrmA